MEAAAAPAWAAVVAVAVEPQVAVAVQAQALLEAEGIWTRVVSTPCWELFDQQPAHYQEAVLGKGTVRVAVEAAVGFGWRRFIGEDGVFVGMSGFGASAPAERLYEHFGVTPAAVAAAARARLG